MALSIGDAGTLVSPPFNSSGAIIALSSPCAPGDLIIGYWVLGNCVAPYVPIITDNVNLAPFAYPSFFRTTGGGSTWNSSFFWKVCDRIGTPTLSISASDMSVRGGGGAVGGYIAAYRVTGFTSIPTLNNLQTQQTVGTIAGVTGPALVSNYNPEFFAVLMTPQTQAGIHTSVAFGGGFTSQTALVGGTGDYPGYRISTLAPGSAIQMSATLDTVNPWMVRSLSFSDGNLPVTSLQPWGLGPNPFTPFNNNQFHSFPYTALYVPIPLQLNLDPATYTFMGSDMALSAITTATLLMNPGLFVVNGLPITFVLGPAAGVLFGTTGRSGGRVVLTAKRQGESIGYAVDFLSSMAPGETITSASCTCTVYSGTDASPQSMVLGPSTYQGTIVNQGIGGGVVGCIYSLLYRITTNLGQTIEINGYLAVMTDAP